MIVIFVFATAVSVILVSGNWLLLWRSVRTRRGHSAVPFIGGIAGAVALLASPWPRATTFWWVPFLLDWGSLPVIVHTIIWRLRHRGSTSRNQSQ